MFRRRNSQKPAEAFYDQFKNAFRNMSQPNPNSGALPPSIPAIKSDPSSAGIDQTFDLGNFGELEGKHREVTPRAMDLFHGWGRTPGAFDNNTLFDPPPGGFWPPTPAGSNNPHGPSAGDLAAFNQAFGLGTPVSDSASQPSFQPRSGSESLSMGQFMMPTASDFMHQQQHFDTSQSYPPDAFNFHTAGPVSSMQQSQGLRMSDISLASNAQNDTSTTQAWQGQQHDDQFLGSSMSQEPASNFRFRVLLKEKTAMIKHAEDIPVTYLNKSQTYSISVKDTVSPRIPCRYRTSIRVSFEDEVQRTDPSHYWGLWKDGRGINESHKRGGRLQAVEYVNPDCHGGDSRAQVQVVTETFDGFSVIWTPTSTNNAECSVQARFNFLSTDFSHSKGVKGAPVRLCAKTEIIGPDNDDTGTHPTREISYCSVKLFRDHGAERKLTNDRTHINKQIERIKQQIEQGEAGFKDNGKRRRSDSIVGGRPSKIAKHKRTWSVSSDSSLENPEAGEDELSGRLRMFSRMLSSTRADSCFYLKADEQDDLDTHPVTLGPGGSATLAPPPLRRDTLQTISNTSTGSSIAMSQATNPSRSPSGLRIQQDSARHYPTPVDSSSRTASNDWQSPRRYDAGTENDHENPQHLASPPGNGPTRIMKLLQGGESEKTSWIETLDLDKSHKPPPERSDKPVACFYIKPSMAGEKAEDDYYRAVYVMRRTLNNLVLMTAEKCGIDAKNVASVVRVNAQGLQIKVEDEMIREMLEGQDILVDIDTFEATPASAEQFLQNHEEADSTDHPAAKYKFTLRY